MGKRYSNKDHLTFVVAEAGVNHNGSLQLAKELVDAAAWAKADAVKFQTFSADKLVTKTAGKVEYQEKATDRSETQFEMLCKLELDAVSHQILFDYCKEKSIKFMSSPFDLEGIELLISLGVEIFKIPSGEIVNLPYLRKIGRLKKKIILSTGMADLGEIEDALDVLVSSGTGLENITVLHCCTEYPAPMGDVNLLAMQTIARAFQVKVGYSDHTLGIEVPIAAVALGASVIEKHLTLDRNMDGPDHKASIKPEEFREMVSKIRNIETALGNGLKKPSRMEIRNKGFTRKSLVARVPITKGEEFSEDNITAKRTGENGISPMLWDQVIGRFAYKDFQEDEIVF